MKKECPNCGIVKGLESFQNNKSMKDGKQCYCRDCHNAAGRASKKRHLKTNTLKTREWRENNRDQATATTRRWSAANREKRQETTREQRRLHPEKHRARAAVERALKQGLLVRPAICPACGCEDQGGVDGRTLIQAHHDDYAKQLDIKWLCVSCHSKTHYALG